MKEMTFCVNRTERKHLDLMSDAIHNQHGECHLQLLLSYTNTMKIVSIRSRLIDVHIQCIIIQSTEFN